MKLVSLSKSGLAGIQESGAVSRRYDAAVPCNAKSSVEKRFARLVSFDDDKPLAQLKLGEANIPCEHWNRRPLGTCKNKV